MVLAYLGIIKTEKEVTEACDTTELGTTSTQISAAFQKYGMECYKMLDDQIRKGVICIKKYTNLQKNISLRI